MKRGQTAFTVLELSVALVIAGLIAAFSMTMFKGASQAECYTKTKKQIETVKEAVERFSIKNDRFPRPSRRNVGVDSTLYGREVAVADLGEIDSIINADGTKGLFGAIPFQALGIPVENASDCWGNKLTYVVTEALTSSGFLDPDTNGAFVIKTNNSITFLGAAQGGAGYAIISHGADQLGAVKNNYQAGTNTLFTRQWCSSSAELRTQNCDVTNSDLISTSFNDGKSGAANFFDDIIVYRGKPWRIGIANSNAYAWGMNNSNELAISTGNNPQTSPAVVKKGIQFKTIAAGNLHTCAIATDGKAYCWGQNTHGQIGDGTVGAAIWRTEPTLVDVSALPVADRTFKTIATGEFHTCAISTAGNSYCWGINTDSQLGDGTVTQRLTPRAVTPPVVGVQFGVITTGNKHTCALTTDGKPYCWGRNTSGQLGVGTFTPYATPRAVATGGALPIAYAEISAAGAYTCAITPSNTAYCWGDNASGQLGINSTDTERQVPTLIAGSFVSISAGDQHACALSPTGGTYCWGDNDDGELGDSTLTGPRRAPVLVTAPFNNYVQITMGAGHSCGLTTVGKAYCWGQNTSGQVGDGVTATYRNKPEPVAGTRNYSTISASARGANARVHTNAIVGTPARWGAWGACSGACAGGAGFQNRTCATGTDCIGLSSVACVNNSICPPPSPCPSGSETACGSGASPATPANYIGQCTNGAAVSGLTSFMYACPNGIPVLTYTWNCVPSNASCSTVGCAAYFDLRNNCDPTL